MTAAQTGSEKQSKKSNMARGGQRAGAGRKPGVVSQATRDIRDMAKDHADAALRTLAQIAMSGESEAARVSAANSILDRAYGKPSQGVELGGPGGGAITLERIERVIIDPKHRDAPSVRPAIGAKAL